MTDEQAPFTGVGAAGQNLQMSDANVLEKPRIQDNPLLVNDPAQSIGASDQNGDLQGQGSAADQAMASALDEGS